MWITRLGFGRDAMDRIANHKTSNVTDVYDRHGYAKEELRIMAAWRDTPFGRRMDRDQQRDQPALARAAASIWRRGVCRVIRPGGRLGLPR